MGHRKPSLINRRDFSRNSAVTLTSLAFAGSALANPTDEVTGMEKVTGIGGFFFVAEDPEALGQWYRDNLGVDLAPQYTGGMPWAQDAGFTVFDPFAKDNDMIPPGKSWMINFRVSDIEKMVAQLTENGNEVSAIDSYPHGKFATLVDPEGNGIQLWELAG
ncbi:MAG: VOC family protein [Pseudomonadota bacterium]